MLSLSLFMHWRTISRGLTGKHVVLRGIYPAVSLRTLVSEDDWWSSSFWSILASGVPSFTRGSDLARPDTVNSAGAVRVWTKSHLARADGVLRPAVLRSNTGALGSHAKLSGAG